MDRARYMTETEVESYRPGLPEASASPLDRARRAMERAGCGANQQMGTRWPIGCVALEITQRCNLDCTLCYLSDSSEAVRDMPLEEVFRRIEMIYRDYGGNTDVQITGGEPTLRNRDELLEIVRRVNARGMRATLMTNGIRATRTLLESLAECGLQDVAFHVDTTQRRKGYGSEVELNELRQKYIGLAAGLRISVMFNTTVHDGNFHEIPDVVRFFKVNAAHVRTASFQLQAETGRGVQGKRSSVITPESVAKQIERGADTPINFSASLVGHPRCNRYGLCLEAGGRLHDAFDDARFIGRMQSATAGLALQRNNPKRVAREFLLWLLSHPGHVALTLKWTLGKAWRMRRDLVGAKGRVRTLSFVIHNFMDARALERDRIEACSFMAMTGDGPVSMCLHNAKRDSYILQPVRTQASDGQRYWQPLSGQCTESNAVPRVSPGTYPLKRLKGRLRKERLGDHGGAES